MKKRTQIALTAGATALLITGGGITAWQIAETRAEQAFIADQYAKLEADKAALEDDAPPAFYEPDAALECENLWERSTDARRYWEVYSVTTSPAVGVTDGLYQIGGDVSGTDGRKDITSHFSCTVLLEDDEWVVSLG